MYYDEVEGFKEDGLIGGHHIRSIVHNVEVAAGVVRGHLIYQGSDGTWSPVTENADAEKTLAIAARDFTPTEGNAVTQAYLCGVFNVEKIYVGSNPAYSLGELDKVEVLIGEEFDLPAFEQALRTQGIWLTSLK